VKISSLPPAQLYIIQGNYSVDSIPDLPQRILWINWKDKKILQDQVISGKTLQNLLKSLKTHKIIDPSIANTLISISNTINQTKTLIRDLPVALDKFRSHESFYEFVNLHIERIRLEQELQWASFLEARSKTNVGMKRIQRLNEEINELEKKKRLVEPQYEFLKHSEEVYIDSLKFLNSEVKRINKTYISKTSQINKLKRKIDSEKPKSDLYEEKLEELALKIPASQISDNKDYIRISNKLNSAETAIKACNQEIFTISEDITEFKTQLKDLKKKLRELKQTHNNRDTNFIEIQTSFTEVTASINEKESEKENLVKNQTMDNPAQDMGDPPANIRFSSIIMEELRSNTIQISKYVTELETTPSEYIAQNIDSLELSKSILSNLTKKIDLFSEDSLVHFQNIMFTLENSLNLVFHSIGMQLTFRKLPLVQQSGELVPLFGIQFELRKNNKSIKFEKLPVEEKLYVMWSFEYALNEISGLNTHIFADTDYKIKRTKSLLEKTIRLMKNGFLSKKTKQKFVILLSKSILEDTTQKDVVITTI
jgi:DNA repair exonuclease SbcCD ATPase subunit